MAQTVAPAAKLRGHTLSKSRSVTLPWFFLVLAGIAALLGSGDLDAHAMGDRIALWFIAAAVVAAIQGRRATTVD